jgi:Cyclin, N-terminal domain
MLQLSLNSAIRSPSTVLDIDLLDDLCDPQFIYDHDLDTTTEILQVMLKKQEIYLLPLSKERSPEDKSEKWRAQIIQWFFDVVDHTEHDRSVVSLAVNILDRYVDIKAPSPIQNRRDYSLAAITCLMLGSKLYVSRHTRGCHISIPYILHLAKPATYSKDDIEALELDVLLSIRWLVHPPIVPEYIEHIFHLLPRWERDSMWRRKVIEQSRYAAEVTLMNDALSPKSASIVTMLERFSPARLAVACVWWAIEFGVPEVKENSPTCSVRTVFWRNVVRSLCLSPSDVSIERNCVTQNMLCILHLGIATVGSKIQIEGDRIVRRRIL